MNKEEFQKLPINTGLALLWLVHKDAKSMATISTDFEWSENVLSNKDKFNIVQEKVVRDALKEMGIKYRLSKRFGNTLHVSKDEEILLENEKLELLDTEEAHFKRGIFYGFGESNSKVYAEEVVKPGEMFPNKRLIHATMVPDLVDEYWYPYIEYLVRVDHEREDSIIAKEWADIVRKDLPELAEKYEKQRQSDLAKFRVMLTEIYGF